MRRVSTTAFAALSGMFIGLPACADAGDLHPTLGKKPPLEVLNKDILALPERERQAFIHGAMVQMISGLAGADPKRGKCIADWYFDIGDGQEAVELVVKTYPDYATGATLHTLGKRACPEIRD